MGPTGESFENRRGQRVILQKIGFRKLLLKKGHALEEVLKTNGNQRVILEKTRV